MNKERINQLISNQINNLLTREKDLKQEIEKIKQDRIELHQKLECDHELRTDYYKDYYSKITTYICDKCGFYVEY